jgi:hypothetical protein
VSLPPSESLSIALQSGKRSCTNQHPISQFFFSICVLISLVANLDWPLFQLDVKNAFSHENLHEEVYMEQPHGGGGGGGGVRIRCL